MACIIVAVLLLLCTMPVVNGGVVTCPQNARAAVGSDIERHRLQPVLGQACTVGENPIDAVVESPWICKEERLASPVRGQTRQHLCK
jgi:hypothetical protein